MQLTGGDEAAHNSIAPAVGVRLLHRFRRARASLPLETKLGCGDMVSISSMPSADGRARARWAMATGIIKELDSTEVAVMLQARLPAVAPGQLLRIDKEEIMAGFGTCRNNVLALLAPQACALARPSHPFPSYSELSCLRGECLPAPFMHLPWPCVQAAGDASGCAVSPCPLLRCAVDLEAPRFFPADEVLARLPPATLRSLQQLNVDQREAVTRVLSSRDYSLILGMPGTGKTTVIAHAVSAIVGLGQTVLLSAYTHSALDNVLIKLIEMGVPLLRLGDAQGRVHPKLHPHCIDVLAGRVSDTSELARLLADRLVVATTSLSLGHVLLAKRKFDVCIVDEAGQITEPVCVGPLRFAERFVLVGDHYQLRPLVTMTLAAERGMDVSLFSRLCEAHPHAVSRLRLQYRMNADIMSLSNELIYSMQLRCGSAAVANAALDIPRLAEATHRLRLSKVEDASTWAAARAWAEHSVAGASRDRGLGRRADWLECALLPEHRVVFIDTDAASAHENRARTAQGNVYNSAEAAITAQLLGWLAVGGVAPERMAFLSPYRAQLKEVRSALPPSLGGVEALTVDKGQGRDFDCLVLTMVRSNDHGAIGSLLSDWRRLNVAFTRAKRKLIVVGSRRTLQHSPILSCFLELVDRRGWCLELPPLAAQLYTPPPAAHLAWIEQRGDQQPCNPEPNGPSVRSNRPITANLVHEVQQRPPVMRAEVGTASAARLQHSDW
jgi:DNA replication ATP-dependent helicase Dna2